MCVFYGTCSIFIEPVQVAATGKRLRIRHKISNPSLNFLLTKFTWGRQAFVGHKPHFLPPPPRPSIEYLGNIPVRGVLRMSA